MELKEIDRNNLIPSEWNPRSSFDEEKLKLLRESINGIGLVEPLVVRPHPNKKGTYFITAGERRWQSKPNGKFLCLVRNESELESKVSCLVENYVRENIADIDHEKFITNIYNEGIKTKKWTSENDMAKRTGIPRSVIKFNLDAYKDRQDLSLSVTEDALTTSDILESKPLKEKPIVRKKLLYRRAKDEIKGHHAVRHWSSELNKLPNWKAEEVVESARDLNDVKIAVEIHEGRREEGFYVNGKISKVASISFRCQEIFGITPVFIDTIKKQSEREEAIKILKLTYEHLSKLLTELNALGVVDINGKEVE